MPEFQVQELFAALTSQFEDVSALATEGQRAGFPQEVAIKLLQETGTGLAASAL